MVSTDRDTEHVTEKFREGLNEQDKDMLLLDKAYLENLSHGQTRGTYSVIAHLPSVECVSCLGNTSAELQKVPELRYSWDNARKAYILSSSHPDALYLAVKKLRAQGFDPHILKPDLFREERIKINRSYLTKLAVAGATSGNIMLLTLGSYGGATGRVDRLFNLVSGLLFLVIMGFCASPLYLNAFSALKARRLSIDVPLVIAIAMGGVLSYVNLLHSNGAVYFDSLSMLVFLILSTRYVQRRAEQAAYDRIDAASKIVPPLVMRIDKQGTAQSVSIDRLNPGDLLMIHPGDVIPVDSVITTINNNISVSERAYIDLSVVTGESKPQAHFINASLSAGAVNVGASITVTVSHRVNEGKLSGLLAEAATHKRNRAHIVDFSEHVARTFTAVVVSASLIAFLLFLPQGVNLALERVLSFLLVSCPCALALAVPLTFAVTQGRAAARSVFIKSGRSFEVLASKPHFVFDKTGTLTKGTFKVKSVVATAESITQEQWSIYLGLVRALESVSRHPVAHALSDYSKGQKLTNNSIIVHSIKEEIGKGVSGVYNGDEYSIKRFERPSLVTSSVALYKNQTPQLVFNLTDEPHTEAKEVIQWLKDTGHRVTLLSGDSKGVCEYVGHEVGIQDVVYEASPEDKQDYIMNAQKSSAVVMVGDGANDSAALMAADLGVAVRGGLYSSLSSADIYIMSKSNQCGISHLRWLVSYAKNAYKSVKLALALSVVYNLVASTAALLGYISPLVAAVAMPLSSIVVVLIAIRRPRDLRVAL